MFIKDISRNQITIPISIVVSLILTTLSAFFVQNFLPASQPSNPVWNVIEQWNLGSQQGIIINYLIALAAGWGIFKINEVFSLNSFRSYLPYLFYLLLQITNPSLQFVSEGTFTALFGITAIAVLFASYQRYNPSNLAFWVGLLLGVLGLFWTKALLYAPLFILGFWIMRSWRFRVLLGAILGLVTPFWLQFSWMFFTDNMPAFLQQFTALTQFDLLGVMKIGLPMQANLAVTLLLSIVSCSYLMVMNLREKVRTQACYNFIILLNILSMVLCVVDTDNLTGHLTFLYTTIAFLASNIFLKVQTKLSNILFLLIIFAYLTAYVYNLWII